MRALVARSDSPGAGGRRLASQNARRIEAGTSPKPRSTWQVELAAGWPRGDAWVNCRPGRH